MNLLQHLIGRSVTFLQTFLRPTNKTFDETRTNYKWWDEFRNGKQHGYEISGPQAQSLIEVIASWVLGRGVTLELAEVTDKRRQGMVEHTNDALRRVFSATQAMLSDLYDDLLGLGDQYIHVSTDGAFTPIRPDTVQVVLDKQDATKVDHMTVVSVYDTYVLEEEFHADKRIRRLKKYDAIKGKNKEPLKFVIDRTGFFNAGLFIDPPPLVDVGEVVFPNPLERIPIVHFANGKKTGEVYGRPVFEALIRVFSELDDVTSKMFKGAKIMGTPVPVISGLADPQSVKTANKSQEDEEYIDKDGNTDTRETLKWDEDSIMLLGENAEFGFKAPPVGFSHDTTKVTDEIRRLMRDKVHVPPHMWGGTETKKEAADVQVDPWVRIIEGLRDKFAGKPEDEKLALRAEGGIHELAYLYLKARSLTDSKILVAPTVIRWADLAKDDKAVLFEEIKWAHSRGLVTNVTALRLMDLVENVDSEVKSAQEELTERTEQMFDDFGGVGNEASNPTAAGASDKRQGNGADAPRMPAQGGGGRGTGSSKT